MKLLTHICFLLCCDPVFAQVSIPTNDSTAKKWTFIMGQFDPIVLNGHGVCPDGKPSGATIHTGHAALYISAVGGKGEFDDQCLCRVMAPSQDPKIDVKAKLYPNPATTKTTLKSDELYKDQEFSFQVFTFDGKQQLGSGSANAAKLYSGIPFDISSYAVGVYLIVLTNKGTNQRIAFKLIKA